MLRRGTDTQRARSEEPGVPAGAPGVPAPASAGPIGLGDWTAPRSYLELDRELVAELVRVALASPRVASIRNGELAVGSMLAALAIRGEDALIDQLLPLAGVELRIHRYAVGRLDPIAVHPVGSLAEMLRSLARCAVQPQGETWEAVANDGQNAPVAVAAARNLELRWLQPPAADTPHDAPWAPLTTQTAAPGSTVAEWRDRLAAKPTAPAPPVVAPAPLPAIAEPGPIALTAPATQPVPAFGTPAAAPAAPTPAFTAGPSAAELVPLIEAAVERALANAPLELDLDASTLDELRDTTVIERLVDAVGRLERQVGQVDALARQVTALTAAIDDLADANRSLLRHEWDNLPPQGFWVRIQKADDELRRAIDELANEVRGRRRTP